MPVRAIQPDGTSLQAFDCTDTKWLEVKARVRQSPTGWRLPCCSAGVVAKTSRKGLAFFSHRAKGTCDWAPETEHHVRLKNLAVAVARRHGWIAQTEVRGITADGEEWVADVLAQRGRARVAIEIQWSPQTEAELRERQTRYARDHIRGLWLIRSPTFPACPEVPAVCVCESSGGEYDALIPAGNWGVRRAKNDADWAYRVAAESLLDAAFAGRLRWGVRQGELLAYRILAATAACWRCKEETCIITELDVNVSGTLVDLSISDFEMQPELLQHLVPDTVRREHRIGELKPRFSKTERASYLSNGCFACGALQGRFFKH